MRGEHANALSDAVLPWGPSPRARGAPHTVIVDIDGTGTIPACAGSTLADLGRYPQRALNWSTLRDSDTSFYSLHSGHEVSGVRGLRDCVSVSVVSERKFLAHYGSLMKTLGELSVAVGSFLI